MQKRMHTDVSACIEIGLKLVPEFGRLILEIPFKVFVPGREITLFGTRAFFVAANSYDNCLIILLLNDCLKCVFLEQTTTFDTRNPAVGKSLGLL